MGTVEEQVIKNPDENTPSNNTEVEIEPPAPPSLENGTIDDFNRASSDYDGLEPSPDPAPEEQPINVKRNQERVWQPAVRYADEYAGVDEYDGVSIDEPVSYRQAMRSPQKAKWKIAVEEELKSIKDTESLIPSILPAGRRALPTKFVLRLKLSMLGNIERYKARLVALGNLKVDGLDFTKTFAPVVDSDVALTIISVMVERNAEVDLVDFQTAFINGDIEEELYVTLPRDYDPNQ